MDVSDESREKAFPGSARLFPWVAVIGAVFILISSLAAAWADYYMRLEFVRTSVMASPAGGTVDQLKPAVQALGSFAYSGVAPALLLVAAGIVIRVAGSLANSQKKPPWAPRLDEGFRRRAELFAKVSHATAWTALAIIIASMAVLSLESAYGYFLVGGSAGGQAGLGALMRAESAVSSLAAGLKVFFVLLLGAMVVRALLLLCDSDGEGADAG